MNLIETGIRKEEQMWTCNDELKIAKENKVVHERRGVLISGKGTAMMVRNNIETQMARREFNDEKTIVHIIKGK